MKFFNIREKKNHLLYLITPYYFKSRFFNTDDRKTLAENNRAWNLEANKSDLAASYDARHGYLAGEGSAYPLISILDHYFAQTKELGQVLELGAGSGFITSRLALQSSRWVAVEFVLDLLECIRKMKAGLSIGQIELVAKSIFDADFSPQEFDNIFLANTLHHLTDRGILLDKIYRWLKPGGTLYSLEPRHNIQRVLQLTKKYFTLYRKDENQDFTTHDFILKIEFRELLKKAGFQKVDIKAFDFPLVYHLFNKNREKQFQFETRISKLPVIEHFGRSLFVKAVK